mgnify:CR=1 FL=1
MSLQDLSEYHGLIKLNKVYFLDDILNNQKLFQIKYLPNNSVEIIPLFYCDSIEVSEEDDRILIFDTYKIIIPSGYDGLIHFQSEVDDADCSFCVSFQSNSTLILTYNKLLENVGNKVLTVKYYDDDELVYTYNGVTDSYGYNQHQVPSDIIFDSLEVIV